MTQLRHPHIEPPVVLDVAEERVDEHLAAGWLHEEPPAEADTPTPERPRRNRRAGSDLPKETPA